MNIQDKKLNTIPIFKLLAFTLAGFITIMTETIPAGLLPLISSDLVISEALAGQLISIYALGSVIAAIPVVTYTRSWSRKPLFLIAIIGLFIFNTITAISSNFYIILIARFIAGMSAGIIWGIFAGYARNMVSKSLQGRALTIAAVGQPIALCMGVPLGTWIGSLIGWRGVFWLISLLALLLLIWVKVSIPNFPGQTAIKRKPIYEIFTHPGVRPVLLVIFLWILAHNVLYTFIAPYLASAELGGKIDIILLIFGLSSLIGIWITGTYIDKSLRNLTLISLFGFAIAAILLWLGSVNQLYIFIGIIIWGVTFGGAPTLLQTAIADTAGDGADVAQAMLVTIFNLAVAGGGLIGAILLKKYGVTSFAIIMFFLSIVALIIVFISKKNGFVKGKRV